MTAPAPTPAPALAARPERAFPAPAFAFLERALACAVQRVHGPGGEDAPRRHITAEQLCLAARDLAWQLYGPFADLVLRRWGITCTADLGTMVYLLIERGIWQAHADDRRSDFDDVFEFRTLAAGYRIDLQAP